MSKTALLNNEKNNLKEGKRLQLKNDIITSNPASQTALLPYLSEIIYNDYGYIPKDIVYTKNSVRFGIKAGYGIWARPTYFNRDNLDYGQELQYNYNTTIELNFRLNLLSYERTILKHYSIGAQPHTGFYLGMFPHDDTKVRFDLGNKFLED